MGQKNYLRHNAQNFKMYDEINKCTYSKCSTTESNINLNKTVSRHIKLLKPKDKEQVLKATGKEIPSHSLNSSSKAMEARSKSITSLRYSN